MSKLMIRNSDMLFARTAATYKFVDREAIRLCIREISALQVLGIDKRMPQIMLERGYLKEEIFYAIIESMLQSHQIKKMTPISIHCFTREDEQRFHQYLGLPLDFYVSDSPIPASVLEKNLPISPENLALCISIKKSLAQSGIDTFLLHIISDKGLLNSDFAKILPDLEKKRKKFCLSEYRNEASIRRSTAILFSQIAILNKKMTEQQMQHAIIVWEKMQKLGLDLTYSDVLFCLGYVDKESLGKISGFLASISGIEQYPRLALFLLTPQEQSLFEKLRQQGMFRRDVLEKAQTLLSHLQKQGLNFLGLAEILILMGYLSRQKIVQKWEEIRKKEIAERVHLLEMEQTEEAKLEARQITVKFREEVLKNQEVIQKAQSEMGQYVNDALRWKQNKETVEEAKKLERDMQETFQRSQAQQQKNIKKELELFQKNLATANSKQAIAMHSVIEYYQRGQKNLKLYLAIGALILLMLCLGIFLGVRQRLLKQAEVSWRELKCIR